jgi:phosphopantothenoylcysteine decarboxylase
MTTSESVQETLGLDFPHPSKPRVLLAASGSVAAIKFESLCRSFSEWAEVRAVATKASLHFIDRTSLPSNIILYTDDDEWSTWKKIGDEVLHIELRKWADIMVIAPLSANTLAKVCDFLFFFWCEPYIFYVESWICLTMSTCFRCLQKSDTGLVLFRLLVVYVTTS